jgi:hypothetical protein
MDKAIPYDEPRDPFADALNASAVDVETVLAVEAAAGFKVYPSNVANVRAQVPFLVRQTRAKEMEGNLVRAISDGHDLNDLKPIIEMFRAFVDGWERTLDRSPNKTRGGTVPKRRDDLLDLYGRAWASLAALTARGFPLREYATTRASDPPKPRQA